MAAPTAEQYVVERIKTMFDERLPGEFSDLGIGGYGTPSFTTGYSDEASLAPRDGAHAIRIWVDSVGTDREKMKLSSSTQFRTQSRIYENIIVAVMYTFSVPRDKMGEHKRVAGEALRNVTYQWIYHYVKTMHSVHLLTDYRFGSDRIQGGSRRGLRGNVKEKGDLRESFTMGIDFTLLRDLQARGGINLA